ncbi:MAG: nucleotidyltransferase domain-containing protein [Candidatus Nanoarchaeia archaeon]|nr:nucleotidyltransferase domain-containing protein [Candidatus Nanoarchaeia archaeon]
MPVIIPSRREMMKHIEQRIKQREKQKGTADENDLSIIYQFAEKLIKEFGGFIQGVILFGSVARKKNAKESDFDILVIVDDATWEPTPELIGTWRMGCGKILVDLGAMEKIHITTIGMIQFWDAIRVSDPVILTILRDGKPIVETGFYKPLKKILELGGFRASREAILMRVARAKALMNGVDAHLRVAFDDLYWAMMDATQAALMSLGLYPTSPKELVETLASLKSTLNLETSDIAMVKKMIEITKEVEHGSKAKISEDEIKKYRVIIERYTSKLEKATHKNLKKIK